MKKSNTILNTFELSSQYETELPLVIISKSGFVVSRKNIRLSEGVNFITEDVSNLPKGIYPTLLPERN